MDAQLPKIELNGYILHDIEEAIKYEWLETNGLGGYASCSVVGANVRRYHGLLIAALDPPTRRMMLLSKLSECVLLNGVEYQLDTNLYHPNTVHPTGYRFITSFELSPFPTMQYAIGDATLRKRIVMPHMLNAIIITYELHGVEEATLFVRFFVNARDHHHITHSDASWLREANIRASQKRVLVKLRHYAPALTISFTHGHFVEDKDWYYNFRYPIERERGLEDAEDLFTIGYIQARISPREPLHIIASVEGVDADDAEKLIDAELKRRLSLLNALPTGEVEKSASELVELVRSLGVCYELSEDDIGKLTNELLPWLWLTSDAFVAKRGASHTIIAGYHWFSDWGRDAMISLPGLTLVTKRHRIARDVLKLFGEQMRNGLLPNFFPDEGGQPAFNTIDASLWFSHASYCYLRYTRDFSFVRSFVYERLREIVNWYVQGTDYGIRVSDDGLVSWHSEGMALTWMDAKVNGMPVTPRHGKPVEVNSLWIHCLWFASRLAKQLGDIPTMRFTDKLFERATASFHEKFWDDKVGCLRDVLCDGEFDVSIRPNQLIALMLPSLLFDEQKAHRILNLAIEQLLTPMGLRTLAPTEASYVGRYIGSQAERDKAYHNGTVWAWLIGPLCTAYVRYSGRKKEARIRASGWLKGMLRHLCEGGIGYISEIADGDKPHHYRGCIAQAWSVGEVLRATFEDVLNMRPQKLYDERD